MAAGEATAFEFATASRIIFGAGRSGELGRLLPEHGRRVLCVTGRAPDRFPALVRAVGDAAEAVATFTVPGEPTTALVDRGARQARQMQAEVVVAIGGGSVIDAAKAIAALATNEGEVLDYLEVVGRGRPLTHPALPCLALPTTAGTGAEVTRNAVLTAPAGVKASLRSPFLLPRVALVDPQLTLELPPEVTASTGLDALTQLIEPYLSARANALTDALCRDGIPRAAAALRAAGREPPHLAVRSDLALAALYSGLALANSGLGAVHGFAAPIGGSFRAPHGAVCAALLAPVLRVNLAALRLRAPQHPAIGRMAEIARWMTGDAAAAPEDAAAACAGLARALRIPPLSAWGIGTADVSALVGQAGRASSMQANPLPLTSGELQEILETALAA